jgi:hypothetical protein
MAKNREAAPHSPASRPAVSSAERQQQIAQRAYERHVARGYRHGHDLEDWLDAERDITDAA